MDKEKRVKRRKSKRPSLIWGLIDRFTAFLYSLVVFGRMGDSMSNDSTYCKRSLLAKTFSQRSRFDKKLESLGLAEALQRNPIVRMLAAIGRFFMCLRLNVYGIFFTFYGLTSALIHYILMLINNRNIMNSDNLGLIISSAAITVCSVPLLFSSQTVMGAIAKSRIMSKVVLDFFDIPEEKLRDVKQYGGTLHILFAIISAIVFGLLAYFLTPWYMPFVILCIMGMFLVFSNPEAGVILTIAAVPFFQYSGYTRVGLLIMICITSLSYIFKLIQRRRSVSLSPELTMVLLFCAFILASSLFTRGGSEVMWDAVSRILMICGGFFLTFNLITSKKAIRICTKTLTVVLLAYSLIGIWDGFYNGISDRISDPVTEQLTDISSKVDVFEMFRVGDAFGVLAVLVFPLIFAYLIRQKSAKRVSMMLIASIVTIVACWMCTSYEIVLALIFECALFWLLYSHRSLTAVIVAAIPISICAILYKYAIVYFSWPNISEILAEYMPASLSATSANNEVVRVVLDMISDGNLTGIGSGAHAIEVLLPKYSSILTYSEVYSASVWMQILCSAGVFGLLSFVVFIGFLLKRSFRCFAKSYQRQDQGIGIALLCGITVSLLLGMVTNIWINEIMVYVFWVNVGLLLSYIRASDGEYAKHQASLVHTSTGTDTELVFHT